MSERDTHFFEFAKLLVTELERQGFLTPVYGAYPYTLISRFAYDLVNHTLWHSTPAGGSTIKKYQGMTIEEITQHIPDMTTWPEREQGVADEEKEDPPPGYIELRTWDENGEVD